MRARRCSGCSRTSASSRSSAAATTPRSRFWSRRYESRLLAFCRHLLGSREDAEDVLQEVLAAAFNAMLADDRPINVRPWLYRIARNRSLNHLRRHPGDRRRLDGRPSLRQRRQHRRQGARARGVPAAGRRHPRAARDAEDRARAARDGRALLRADRRGDGDHRAERQVAARARAGLARRGGRGAAALLRRGPDRARRGRRGPRAPAQPARPPAPARVQALLDLPGPAQADQQGARRAAADRPARPAEEARARPPRSLRRLERDRRRRGRGGAGGRRRCRRRRGRRLDDRGRLERGRLRLRRASARSRRRPPPVSPPRRSSPRGAVEVDHSNRPGRTGPPPRCRSSPMPLRQPT